MNRIQIPAQSSQKGVVLLEALIAVLIFSMGILAIAGLQGAMVKNTSDSKYRSDAAFIAQQTIGLMWADPSNLAAKATALSVSAPTLPSGNVAVTLPTAAANGEVKVVVTWQQPGQAQHNYTAYARILGGA